MTENTPQRPQQPGQYGGRPDDHYHPPPPPPPPPPCPEPCGEPPWGPPKIRPECCPPDRECCPDHEGTCTWNEVEDPCVRAASADCGGEWTRITCTCESSNANCSCDEWECGGYPHPTCVPCKPCDGLVPGDEPSPDDCQEPPRDGCDPDELRKQLDALNRCITSRKAEQDRLTKELADRDKYKLDLEALIKDFDAYVKNYSDKWHDLKCREEALKSFYRETAKVFQDPYRFPETCLREMQTAINGELCSLERTKCCLKNLDAKLGTDRDGNATKLTKLLWEQKSAVDRVTKSDRALANLKAFGDWIGGQFTDLEKLRDGEGDKPGIKRLLCSADPQDHNVAFYRFFWLFAPKLCKRFPVAICCKGDGHGHTYPPGEQPPPDQYGQQPPTPYTQGAPQQQGPQGQQAPPYPYPGYGGPGHQPPGQQPPGYPTPPPQGGYGQPGQQPPGYAPQPGPGGYGQPPTPPAPGGYGTPQYPNPGQQPNPQYPPEQYPPHHPTPKPPQRIGCEPGDWHPSGIKVDDLKQLICCAWDDARKKKEELAEADNAVARAKSNQTLISDKVKADEPTLESRIEAKVKKVNCHSGAGGCSGR